MSSEAISLFKATKLLSGFVSSDNGASQAVNAYLRRASTAFTELKNLHKEIRSSSTKETRSGSEVRQRVELEEVGGDNEIDDLVENQESEIVSEDAMKEKKKSKKKKKEEDVVEQKLVDDEERDEERKEKKKKRKSDGEIGSEEKKSKKKRKSKEING